MGELRGGLRAGVLEGGEPTRDAARLDRLAIHPAGWRPSRSSSRPADGRAAHASAGHLPPLLVATTATARFLGGAARRRCWPHAEGGPAAAVSAPGARVVLYTDGLVERRGGVDRRGPRAPRPGRPTAGPGLARTWSPRCLPPEGVLRDDITAVLAVATRTLTRTLAILCGFAAGGCGEIGIHAGFRCLWALRPWRFESSQPHSRCPLLFWALVPCRYRLGD